MSELERVKAAAEVKNLTVAQLQELSMAVRTELCTRTQFTSGELVASVQAEMARYGFTEVDTASPAPSMRRGAVVIGRLSRRGVSVRALCETGMGTPIWKLDVRLAEGELLESTGDSLGDVVRDVASQASEMRANADAYSVMADELLHAAGEGAVKG